jgi:predicted house-cleaning noncanonical NTP pyrophosphatase (MazG superfamily)
MPEYNKLIRDHIPDIIAAEGKTCEVIVMDKNSFQDALRAKLIEEATEAAEPGADLVKELADLYEVIDALISSYGLDKEAILKMQYERRQQRGGFAKQLKLIHVE